jgi:hypothetical protein
MDPDRRVPAPVKSAGLGEVVLVDSSEVPVPEPEPEPVPEPDPEPELEPEPEPAPAPREGVGVAEPEGVGVTLMLPPLGKWPEPDEGNESDDPRSEPPALPVG